MQLNDGAFAIRPVMLQRDSDIDNNAPGQVGCTPGYCVMVKYGESIEIVKTFDYEPSVEEAQDARDLFMLGKVS